MYACRPKVPILVSVDMLPNYIKQEVQRDSLFEKCSNEEIIVINSDNKGQGQRNVGWIYAVIPRQ